MELRLFVLFSLLLVTFIQLASGAAIPHDQEDEVKESEVKGQISEEQNDIVDATEEEVNLNDKYEEHNDVEAEPEVKGSEEQNADVAVHESEQNNEIETDHEQPETEDNDLEPEAIENSSEENDLVLEVNDHTSEENEDHSGESEVEVVMSGEDADGSAQQGVSELPVITDAIHAKSCQVASYTTQENFDPVKFSGLWYEIERTRYAANNQWESGLAYFDFQDNRLLLKYAGSRSGECSGLFKSYGQQRDDAANLDMFIGEPASHGSPWSVGFTYKIIYTDYNVAVTYACLAEDSEGQCRHPGEQIEIFSRKPELDKETRSSVHELIQDRLCVDIEDMVVTAHEAQCHELVGASVPVDCSQRPMCRMYCEHGFVKGEDGCDICKCAELDEELADEKKKSMTEGQNVEGGEGSGEEPEREKESGSEEEMQKQEIVILEQESEIAVEQEQESEGEEPHQEEEVVEEPHQDEGEFEEPHQEEEEVEEPHHEQEEADEPHQEGEEFEEPHQKEEEVEEPLQEEEEVEEPVQEEEEVEEPVQEEEEVEEPQQEEEEVKDPQEEYIQPLQEEENELN